MENVLRKLPTLAAAAALLAFSPAQAAEQILPVPGEGWHIRLDTAQASGKSFNMHLLFARNGKWADVHASIASPTKDDITTLAAVVNSIVIEDDAPAGK